MSPDERFAITARVGTNEWVRVDLDSGASTAVSGRGQLSDNDTLWRISDNKLVRETIGGTTDPDALGSFPTPWLPSEVDDADARGRYVLVWATSGSLGRVRSFLVDTTTKQVLTPDGLGETNSARGRISPDGRIVTWVEYASVGATDRFVRWDRTTGVRAAVQRPAEHDGFIRAWSASPDLEWVTFWSSDPSVLPGLVDVTPRLFRRHLPSGLTQAVLEPTNHQDVSATIHNGGRVIIKQPAPTLPGPGGTTPYDGDQLFYSDGDGDPIQITQGPGGELPTGPLHGLAPFSSRADATRIVLSSLAENLDGSKGGFSARVYRIYEATLPAIPSPNSDAIVAADEEICVPVFGADPGDFVGVNITPILAGTAGFGTLHSSDDAAGETSNVNFAAGTVDPNVAFVEVGSDNKVCFTNSEHGPVHLVLDELIVGDAASFELPTTDGAERLADTRLGLGGDQLDANETRCFDAVGADPGDFVGLNATPVLADAAGFGTLHSSDDTAGDTSNVNFAAGTVDPNVAFVEVGTDGQVCFTNSEHGPVHLVLDELIVGDAASFELPTTNGAERLADT
ncbi:MAG: hypothetical protein QNJ12_22930, partial [Ilumatobacter sp.]|nr:hypothetical protein [Ilumatobacter sp.]